MESEFDSLLYIKSKNGINVIYYNYVQCTCNFHICMFMYNYVHVYMYVLYMACLLYMQNIVIHCLNHAVSMK